MSNSNKNKDTINNIKYRGFLGIVQPLDDWKRFVATVEDVEPKIEVYGPDIVVLYMEFKNAVDKHLDEHGQNISSVKVKSSVQIEMSESFKQRIQSICKSNNISLDTFIYQALESQLNDMLDKDAISF